MYSNTISQHLRNICNAGKRMPNGFKINHELDQTSRIKRFSYHISPAWISPSDAFSQRLSYRTHRDSDGPPKTTQCRIVTLGSVPLTRRLKMINLYVPIFTLHLVYIPIKATIRQFNGSIPGGLRMSPTAYKNLGSLHKIQNVLSPYYAFDCGLAYPEEILKMTYGAKALVLYDHGNKKK